MSPTRRQSNSGLEIAPLLALLEPWPKSWAGIPKDVAVGAEITKLMSAFIAELHGRRLSKKTLRRHINNLWLIGGEVVRSLHEHPSLRKKTPETLLIEALASGTIRLADLEDVEQRQLDATSGKFLSFLLF